MRTLLRHLILAALLAAPARAAVAEDPAPPGGRPQAPTSAASVEEEVDRLLKDIASDDFAVREAARKRLAVLGALARPALEAHREDQDPEIRRTVVGILDAMGGRETAAEQTTDLAAHDLVTFADQGPVADVLHRWEAARGGKFQFVGAPPAAVVDVDAKSVPWFEALDGILTQGSHLELLDGFDQSGQATVVLHKPGDPWPPVAYAGPFRLAAESVTVVRSLRSEAARSYSIGLRLLWAPDVHVLSTGLPILVKALDPAGKRYISRSSTPDPYNVRSLGSSRRSTDLTLTVEAADPTAAERLATVELQVRLRARFGREEVRFDDLSALPATRPATRLKGAEGRAGSATLQSFGPDPDHVGWLIGSLTVSLPPGVTGETVSPLLEASDGSVRTLFEYGTRSVGSDGVLQMTVRSAGLPMGVTPSRVLVAWLVGEGQGAVSFVLKDVPLR